MKGGSSSWLVSAAIGLLMTAAPLAALAAPAKSKAPAKSTASGKSVFGGPKADWTGVWVVPGSFLDLQDGTSISAPSGRSDPGIDVIFSLGRPKLKPEVAKLSDQRRAAEAAGVATAAGAGGCHGSGPAGFWAGPYAWEIVQSPTQINLYQEYAEQVRRIYTDGRKHPNLETADPLFFGHSVGHWEGNVLVVDTANISSESRINDVGSNNTEKSRIVERFTPVGPERLDVDVTVYNPDILAEPWHFVRKLYRKAGMEVLDYICDNDRNPVVNGVTQTILPPQPK